MGSGSWYSAATNYRGQHELCTLPHGLLGEWKHPPLGVMRSILLHVEARFASDHLRAIDLLGRLSPSLSVYIFFSASAADLEDLSLLWSMVSRARDI